MEQRTPESTDGGIVRVHRLNFLTNIGLAVMKVVIGLLAGSGALIADGLNSTSDLLSNLVAWGGYRFSLRPPDEDHHYGHGNAEAIAAMAIGAIILAAGGAVIWRAFTGQDLAEAGGLGTAALVAASISVVVSLWMSQVNLRAGTRTHSQVLVALGRDKRSDAYASMLVLVGVGGSVLGWSWIEPLVTGLVGIWIAILGLKSIAEAADVLMDRVTDPKLRGEIQEVAGGVSEIERVDEVRIHPLGATYSVDLTIHVNGSLTVERGHELAQEVEATVTRHHDRVVQVQVHVEPI